MSPHLRKRYEIARRHPATPVSPADQRLRAVDRPGRGVDLRLVIQLELIARERMVQIALELDLSWVAVLMPAV
jgi:hypothetical protein